MSTICPNCFLLMPATGVCDECPTEDGRARLGQEVGEQRCGCDPAESHRRRVTTTARRKPVAITGQEGWDAPNPSPR